MKKDKGIEYLRTICIIAVISIHILYQGFMYYGETLNRKSYTIWNGIMNSIWWAVPCFVMITGVLLLNPNRVITIKKLYKKYILRMVVVLLLFGVGYAWMEEVFNERTINVSQIFKAFLYVLEGKSWAHLWYIYGLLGLYLLIPIYKVISEKMSDKEIVYIIAVLTICEVIVPMLEVTGLKLKLYCHFSGTLPLYFILGIAVNRNIIKLSTIKARCLFGISTILLFGLSIVEKMYDYNWENLFGYSSLFVMIQAVSLMYLISNMHINNKIVDNIIMEIADKSFGIYLIHMFFINIVYKVLKINPFENIVIVAIVLCIVLVCSYIITYILRFIPGFRKVL